MKQLSIIFLIGSIFLISISFTQPTLVFAGDEYYENHETRSTESIEGTGKILGFFGASFAVLAGLLFPVRIWIKRSKEVRKKFRNLHSFLTNGHMVFGFLAIICLALHGMMMFLMEQSLTFREYIGLSGFGLFLIAAVFGNILNKIGTNKRLRSFHILIALSAISLGFIHILLS